MIKYNIITDNPGMMNSVDFSDPDQAATALQAMMTLMKRKRVMDDGVDLADCPAMSFVFVY